MNILSFVEFCSVISESSVGELNKDFKIDFNCVMAGIFVMYPIFSLSLISETEIFPL